MVARKMKKAASILLALSLLLGLLGTAALATDGDEPAEEAASVTLTVDGGEARTIDYVDGSIATLSVDGGDKTILSVVVDGETVVDNARVEGDGSGLSKVYENTFEDGEAHEVEVTLGYKLVMTTWYVDYQKSLGFSWGGHESAVKQITAAQVDPDNYPAKTVTYVIPAVSDEVTVDVYPEESGEYVRGIMASAYGYNTMDFGNGGKRHVDGGHYYNTFPFHGAPDKGNNTYGFYIDSMSQDHIVEFPVRLFPLQVDYIPVLEQVDGSWQYVYGENPGEYPDNYWMHAETQKFVVDGSPIEAFGAQEGYRLSYGYFWGGRWGSYNGDHIFHTNKNGAKVNYLEEALGLTVNESTGEISGSWKLVDEINFYEVYMEYSLLRPVTYDANGGSGEMTGAEYVKGETVTVAQNSFTRSGFNFTGWNTAADGSGTAYTAGDSFGMGAVAGVTLYAQWSEIPVVYPDVDYDYYTVTVNYLDKDSGAAVAERYRSSRKIEGSRYDVSEYDAVAIEGYTYDSTGGDALSGTLNRDKVVNVYYVKDETAVTPDEPIIPDEPTVPGESTVDIPDDDTPTGDRPDVPGAPVDPAEPETPDETIIVEDEVPMGNLPQTGTAAVSTARVLGMTLLSMSLVLACVAAAVWKRREQS